MKPSHLVKSAIQHTYEEIEKLNVELESGRGSDYERGHTSGRICALQNSIIWLEQIQQDIDSSKSYMKQNIDDWL